MIKALLFTLLLAAPIFAHYQAYPGCGGTVNNQPILDVPMQLVDSVPNGKKYVIQSSVNDTHLTVLALKGSSYEMGVAYGTLMKHDILENIPGMFDYIAERADDLLDQLKDLLPWILKWIPNLMKLEKRELVQALLNLQYETTKKYTPQRFTDEIRGMAKGSGCDEKKLRDLNLFPELIKAQCSMFGLWGKASSDGGLLQLRALDWDFNAYIAKFPIAVLYFPDEAGSNPFANFGFTSMVGALSGYSTKVAISEKVWLPSSTDFRSFYGEPFPYVLRDILQFGNDLQSTVNQLFKTPRTCTIHVGVGSKKDNSFYGLEIAWNALHIYNDKNYTNYTEAHPQMDGVMFWDKHPQPSKDACLGAIIKENYGKIDAEFIHKEAAPLHQTGDTQIVIYDFKRDTAYLSYSDPVRHVKAFHRPILKLDMKKLLDIKTHF